MKQSLYCQFQSFRTNNLCILCRKVIKSLCMRKCASLKDYFQNTGAKALLRQSQQSNSFWTIGYLFPERTYILIIINRYIIFDYTFQERKVLKDQGKLKPFSLEIVQILNQDSSYLQGDSTLIYIPNDIYYQNLRQLNARKMGEQPKL